MLYSMNSRMNSRLRLSRRLSLTAALLGTLLSPSLMAQNGERWFQIEVSVFSNELASDRNEEVWTAERTRLDYPQQLQRLQTLIDLLMIPELIGSADSATDAEPLVDNLFTTEPSAQEIREQIIAETGPFPPSGGDTYRIPDFARDAFVQLPASESDFQQTNRALDRSSEHRLLFHGLWRQPMPDPGSETPVLVLGGQQFDAHHELQGSLSLHFNAGRDRVVIDADLWLSEFVRFHTEPSEWTLPALPETTPPLPDHLRSNNSTNQSAANQGNRRLAGAAIENYEPARIFHMQQSRDMRSNEFHYLDHPALGIVVMVFPYEVPPALPAQPTDALE